MKETLKYALAVGITAAAMFAYMHEAPPRQAAHELAQNTPAPTTAAALTGSTEQETDPHQAPHQRELSPAELADIDPASIDWEAVINQMPIGLDQLLLRMHSDEHYPPEVIAAFNKLHVIEFNPVVQVVCHDKLNENFVDGVVTICHDIKGHPDHPYENFDYEDLLELAETDPAAAVFASRKAEKIEDRMGMALRAAALSGKPGPILATAAKEFTTPGITYDEDNKIASGGGTIPSTVINRMILESIAQRMGDPRAKPKAWTKYIGDFAKTDEEKSQVLELIDKATRHAMEGMALIQQEVTGSTQVRELLDA
jgi:hypothetical protein